MVVALLTAGIVSVLAGLAAMVYGVQYKDFGFGNTLIVVGATAICTGMLLVGLWVVVGELRQIARRLIPRTAAESRGRPGLPPPGVHPLRGADVAFGRDEAAQDEDDLETAAPPLSSLPWQDEAAPRERPRMPPLPEFNPEPAPLRIGRDRQFPPTRRDRERAASRPVEALGSDASAGEAAPSASVNFENAWPKPERARPSEPEPPRRSARPSSPRFADLASEDRSASTIIKSGVVDGMAYSLYSDGSIEAQMPEGMMRFGSIEELRAHLGQR